MGELLDRHILDRLPQLYTKTLCNTMVLAYYHFVQFTNLLTGTRLSHPAY